MKNTFIVMLLITAMLLISGVYWLAFDLDRLAEGELISQATSPEGTYTLKAYRVNPHATVSYAVRGELHFNTANTRPHTIYWNYREETAAIEWKSENLVSVSGVDIPVPYGVYDFRRQ